MGRSHHRPVGDVSVAALLLALAVLAGDTRSRARTRCRSESARLGDSQQKRAAVDPLAAASALEVFAVCLSAGMAVPTAAALTAPSAPPVLRAMLQRAADLLELGADADTAWSVPGDDPVCAGLARLARRSAASGSALAQGVAELAETSRQDAAHRAAADAERAGVLIAGPLGLCFLPAFVCLGVAPVVAGLAADVFSAGLL